MNPLKTMLHVVIILALLTVLVATDGATPDER